MERQEIIDEIVKLNTRLFNLATELGDLSFLNLCFDLDGYIEYNLLKTED